jgi:hypothetical protein
MSLIAFSASPFLNCGLLRDTFGWKFSYGSQLSFEVRFEILRGDSNSSILFNSAALLITLSMVLVCCERGELLRYNLEFGLVNIVTLLLELDAAESCFFLSTTFSLEILWRDWNIFG